MAEDQNVHSIVRTLLGLTSSQQPMETNALIRALATRIATGAIEVTAGGVLHGNLSSVHALTPQYYGAAGDGTTDDTTALQAWLTAITGKLGFLPAATYAYTANLTVPANTSIVGANMFRAVLKPTAAVTKALTLLSGSNIYHLTVDGANTTGAKGIVAGESGAEINDCGARDVVAQNFSGANGAGWFINKCVSGYFDHCQAWDNTDGAWCGEAAASSLPNQCTFRNFTSKSNDRYGVQIFSGDCLWFDGGLFELNGDEAVYSASTGTITDLLFSGRIWFEANHQDNVPLTNYYQVRIDGTNATISGVTFRDVFFGDTGNDPKSCHLSKVTNYLFDNVIVRNTAGAILVDGTSTGSVGHWPPKNGTETNRFTDSSATRTRALFGSPLAEHLTFTDATYDIGAAGATRPRDFFLSRNATLGGTLEVASTATINSTLNINGAGAGQIVFPASQNASAGANTLDDYEENTWTPVIGGSGGTSGQTYTSQVGRYIKIGKMVFCQFYVELSAEGTITGNAQIQGLPFTSENTTNLFAVGTVVWSNLATNWVNVVLDMSPNVTVAALLGAGAAGIANTTALTAADIGNSTAFVGTLNYRATS